MTSSIAVVVKHGGHEYSARHMTVKKTFLGYEDHGILTFNLDCEGGGYGQGVGGIALDGAPSQVGGSRTPQTSGLALVTEVIKVVGADSWEGIPGKHVLILSDNTGRSVGIANPLTGKVLVFGEFLKELRQAADESSR